MSLRKVNASFHSSVIPRKFYHYFICSFAVMYYAFETSISELIERLRENERQQWPIHQPFLHFIIKHKKVLRFFTSFETFSLPPSNILHYR